MDTQNVYLESGDIGGVYEETRCGGGASIDSGDGCLVPEYILLSDEIGTWGGDIAEAKLPDRFLVDYVRVYDLSDQK